MIHSPKKSMSGWHFSSGCTGNCS